MASNPVLLPMSCVTLGSWLSLWAGSPLWLSFRIPSWKSKPLSLSRIRRRRQKGIRSLLIKRFSGPKRSSEEQSGVSEAKKGDMKGMRGHRQWWDLSQMLGRVLEGLKQSCSNSCSPFILWRCPAHSPRCLGPLPSALPVLTPYPAQHHTQNPDCSDTEKRLMEHTDLNRDHGMGCADHP